MVYKSPKVLATPRAGYVLFNKFSKLHYFTTWLFMSGYMYIGTGLCIVELMSRKAAKEHETYASCQVPSQSNFIGHYNQLVSI